MFNRFKYLELTSHHALKKAKKFIAESTKKDSSYDDQIIDVIFSSLLTLFISYLVEVYFTVEDKSTLSFWCIAKYMFLEILLYLFVFFLVKECCKRLKKLYRKHKSNMRVNTPDISPITNKELVDDFDNIAFDNLLVAAECLTQIEEKKKSKTNNGIIELDELDLEVIRFYLYESIYYLQVAIEITQNITSPDRREACLNIRGNTRGVDVYRLINAHKMMSNIIKEVDKIYGLYPNIQGSSAEKWPVLLKTKIKTLRDRIGEIENDCKQADMDINTVY